MPTELIMSSGLTAVFGAVAWLLKNKDAAQAKQICTMEKQIELLFEKHDQDASALQDLRVQIAAKHYERPELDAKFDKLDRTFRDGFHDLGNRFDKLSDVLIQHMTEHRP